MNWMKTLGLSALVCAAAFGGSVRGAEPIAATIGANTEIGKIDERIYSHFLEHIYNSCNGGLWGELVWNRSLEAGSGSMWSVENGVIKQDSMGTDQKIFLGAKEGAGWTDYDVRVSAKKISGDEGFLILFRASADGSSYYWANIGGWGNRGTGIEKVVRGNKREIGERKATPPIEAGKVYDIRVLCVGENIKVFLDGELIHEVVDPQPLKSGCVGVGTWATKAEFGSVVVSTATDGEIYNSVKTPPQVASSLKVRYWNADGNASWRGGPNDKARNSAKYVRFNGAGNLWQPNYNFQEGETYDYSFWTRGKGAVEFFANATVKGADKNDETEFSAKSFAIDANEWVKVTGEFSVPKTNEYGSIRLNFAPADGSYLDIDQISVFPRSWKEKSHGLRPDLLQAIKEIAPEIIRWPGGCYASAYRWKDGIGPQDDRGAFPFEIWNDVDVNSFGIDEFVPFCREVGAEPDMVVNIGTAQWESHLRHVDWMQEVCDWVEYCNGPADSKWGAIRAKNGHPEPYGIKYWEIDNEVRPSDSPSEWYVGVLRELIPRMKKIDPNIKIIACGSWTGDGPRWNREVVEGAGDIIDYISTHRYDDPNGFATNPWSNQYYFESHRKVFENSANPNIKFFHSEWNAQSTDWRTGLHAGGILNCFERVGDLVAIATPALFLRHVSGTAWDNAFVNFDHREWFPAPNYVVMKLWRDNYAPTLVELKSDAEDMNGQMPLINAVATKSEDGKTLYFKAVNNKKTAVEYNLTLDGAKATAVEATLVSPEGDDADAKLRARNDLGAIRISPREAAAKIIDGKVVVEAPSYSALLVKITVE